MFVNKQYINKIIHYLYSSISLIQGKLNNMTLNNYNNKYYIKKDFQTDFKQNST